MVAEGVTNHADSARIITIRLAARFNQSGNIQARIAIPVAAHAFTLDYSGSADRTDLRAFNTWMEPNEHKRVNAGILQSAAFDIKVRRGVAKGSVRAIYKDFSLSSLSGKGKARSSKGIFQRFTSFLMSLKLRGTNEPDRKGAMKIGAVSYTRKPDDAFFQYLWFALRGGISEIIGGSF